MNGSRDDVWMDRLGVRAILRCLAASLNAVGLAVLRAISPKAVIDGVPVYNAADANDPEYSEQIAEALSIISSTTPWHLAHLKRNMRCIIISESRGTEFIPLGATYFVRARSLKGRSADRLAVDIVGAGIEARVVANRVWWQSHYRFRIVRMCYEAQVAFVRRLPDPFLLLEELTDWWDRNGWKVQEPGTGSEASLRAESAPEWLIRLIRHWHRVLIR